MADFMQQAETYLPTLDTQLAMLAVLFLGILFLVNGIAGLWLSGDPIQRRMVFGAKKDTVAAGPKLATRLSKDSALLKRLEKVLAPQDDQTRSTIRQRLAKAGYRRPSAVRNYYIVRTVLGLVVPFLTAAAYPLFSASVEPRQILVILIILFLAGLYLPPLFIIRQMQYRQEAVRDGFPDALDMLLVCVEAGLGLDAALARVAKEVGLTHSVIAEELAVCGLELRAGKSRSEVLKDLAHRVDVDDVKAFVAVLNQSDRYGTDVGSAIRVHASEMRKKRLLRAEEKANKLPVKMALAAIVFTLPPVFMVLISPAAISIFKMLDRLAE